MHFVVDFYSINTYDRGWQRLRRGVDELLLFPCILSVFVEEGNRAQGRTKKKKLALLCFKKEVDRFGEH